MEDMHGWSDYVLNLTMSNDGYDLDRVCIMEISGKRWCASDNSLRPSFDQRLKIWQIFHYRLTEHMTTYGDSNITLGSGKTMRTFYVHDNDGLILEARGGKGRHRNETLCAGRTKKFLVLGGQASEKVTSNLRDEIQHIRIHLERTES